MKRRILLSCAVLAVLALPAVALARADGRAGPGYLVVRKASGDGGINGHAVVTVVVHGFVLGSVRQDAEARVDIYQLPSTRGQGTPQAVGSDVRRKSVPPFRSAPGHEFLGSGFRFSAIGGYYRVVVRGSGVYLFAGGHGNVTLHGSSYDPRADGNFSVDGAAFRSLPTRILKRQIGRG
ncbi:MAG TPA: hypothetical protein VE985_02890 [Gaiellaceae bacterium]|nr:hypothetical protein [Gaiellaceae bacterium]